MFFTNNLFFVIKVVAKEIGLKKKAFCKTVLKSVCILVSSYIPFTHRPFAAAQVHMCLTDPSWEEDPVGAFSRICQRLGEAKEQFDDKTFNCECVAKLCNGFDTLQFPFGAEPNMRSDFWFYVMKSNQCYETIPLNGVLFMIARIEGKRKICHPVSPVTHCPCTDALQCKIGVQSLWVVPGTLAAFSSSEGCFLDGGVNWVKFSFSFVVCSHALGRCGVLEWVHG